MSGIISAQNVTKLFGKDILAVDNISFDIPKGEIFAFLGPNGAGKTTTIRMLTTMLHPTSGTIRLDGHDPVKDQDSVRRAFGIVFQDPSVDNKLTAWENMDIHARLYGVLGKDKNENIERLLKYVDLYDRRDSLLETFSGGMKRRLEIARSFLHKPKILFLDEPTLGLDPQTRNHMWEYVRKLNKEEGLTVFLTTHYMEEAERIADRIAIIDHGKIAAMGNADELKKQTNTTSLEDAFLSVTGSAIRDESASSKDFLRQTVRAGMGR